MQHIQHSVAKETQSIVKDYSFKEKDTLPIYSWHKQKHRFKAIY